MEFRPFLILQPNGEFAKIAAGYDPATGVYTPIFVAATFNPSEFNAAGTDETGEFITIDFTEQLSSAPVPATDEFVVMVDASPVAVTNVEVSGINVILTLGTPVANGETVTVSYTPGTLIGLNGVPVEAFTDESVTNNVPA